MDAPQNPAGAFVPETDCSRRRRDEYIATIEAAPKSMRAAVEGLTEKQLDTRYRNWTIRQIVHHMTDSHVNSYVRFKLTMTEDHPTIKPYDEGKWAELADSREGDVGASLALLDGLHARWVILLRSLSDADFERKFFHPESQKDMSLKDALCYYAWHSRHHTAQITWLRQQHGW